LPTSTSLAQVESILNLGQGHGGNNFNPFFAGRYTSTVYGSLDMSAVGLLGAVSFAGTGGVGQHTGVQAYANRYNIIAQPTTTVAATLGAPANTISIADVSMFQYDAQPVLINGTGYLQVAHSGTSGAGTISVERNIPVTDGTLGRVVTGNNNPQMWGLNINVNDDASNTGMTSSKQSSYTLGCELDFRCSGIDDAGPLLYGSPSGIRHMMTLIGLGGTVGNPAEIGDGIFLAEGGGTHISWKRCFSVGNAAFSQSAFDTRLARQGTSANAIWLGDDHRIALDTNALWTLSANSASAMTINGTAGGTVNFKAGAATWASITAQGVTVSASAPGGVFYGAVPVGEQAFIALGWNGSNVTGYVNGTAVGGFAKIADLGGYLPLATGGTVGGTVSINALTGGWGANNWGKQLLVTVAAATTHPAIAITDVNGVNAWGIANLVGELDFAVMPAYSNSSTAPNKRLQLTATGMGFNGTAPIAKPTGVAVTIAAVHAALVSYGLIAP
jgi:hypothetical protein